MITAPSPILSPKNNDILIVDDTINNVKLLSDMLSQAGFLVRKAITGSMALTAVQASQPDLILLDINMPDMDGFEVCKQLKENPHSKEVPVIFLSASDMTNDKIRAFQIGGADYITKPFHSEEVIARIRHQLLLSQLKSELETKNQDLQAALSQLKATQVELVQQEKMLGLSQLIAGISHEINNPISFIVGNLKPAKQYFFALLELLNRYRQRYPEPGADITEAIAALDLDFITQDFADIIKSMEAGTTRINQIVQALQTFSHQGESPIKTVDLKTTLESILTLLQPRLQCRGQRPGIQVQCHYQDVPPVTCDARLINQAILHVLDNAIDAIDALWNDGLTSTGVAEAARQNPEIMIALSAPHPQRVAVSIRDNGIGISDSLKPRIFDPFFTTKSVGQGNGLGLSIAYQVIVGKHQGTLSFTSSILAGSQFTLEIPTDMAQS